MTKRMSSGFADLGVNAKILSAIGMAALVAVVVSLLGISGLQRTAADAQQLYAYNFAGLEKAETLRRLAVQQRSEVADHALTLDDAGMAAYEKAIRASEQQARVLIAALAARPLTAAQSSALTQFEARFNQYVKIRDEQLMPASRSNDGKTWQDVRDREVRPLADSMDADLDTIVEEESRQAEQAAASAHETYMSNLWSMIVTLGLGLALALGLGVLIARMIVGSLRRLDDVAAALARGDLTHLSGLTSRDEIGRMGQNVDIAVQSLRTLVTDIAGNAGMLAGAATELSAVSAQLGAGADEASSRAGEASRQAAQINDGVQTVAAGSDQMNASISEIARNAGQAADVARQALRAAEDSTGQVAALSEASSEIGSVVKLITSIAEQTNLLALNATIEAARAGEAGKGFAVVATEVKGLAQQTARATEDITVRIAAIQASTAGAAAAIDEIRSVIGEISEFTVTIASAVEEQSATTSEMGRSITATAEESSGIALTVAGVAEVSSATADGARATKAAAADLSQLASKLNTAVASFTY